MKGTLPLFSILLTLLTSCSSSPVAEQGLTKQEPEVLSVTTETETKGDTLHLYCPAILFMWPDSLQAEQMKIKDSDAFYTTADDFSFYNSQLMDLADSMGIKNFSTSEKYIDFVMAGNKHEIINRAASEDLWWGLFLFNGRDKPQQQGTVDVDASYLKNYFKR